MEFWSYTLSEAGYLWMGLAIQEYLRFSRLRGALPWIVAVWSLVLLYRALSAGAGWPAFARVLGYWCVMLGFTCVFWPEATRFGWGTEPLTGRQIRSVVASADPSNPLQTADQVPIVPATFQTVVTWSPGFRLFVPSFLEYPVQFGRYINSTSDRPFASLLPWYWLLGTELTGDGLTSLHDWVKGCYHPVLAHALQAQSLRTEDEALPWGSGPVAQLLAQRMILPGATTAVFPRWLYAFVSPNTEISCTEYLQRVLEEVQRWLLELRSPAGRPLLDVFQQELGLPPVDQALFLVRREIQKQAAQAIEAPSVVGAYAGVRALSLAARLTGGLVSGTVLSALGNEFSRNLDQLTIVVRIALALTWWLPDFMGVLQLVLLGFFPVYFVLWTTVPGQQFHSMAVYGGYFAYACSLPLWWAVIEVASRLAVLGATQPLPFAPLIRQYVLIIIGLLTIQGVFAWMLWRSAASAYNALRGG